jgi:hypothetical protein
MPTSISNHPNSIQVAKAILFVPPRVLSGQREMLFITDAKTAVETHGKKM